MPQETSAVTTERAERLFRLLTILGKGPQTRAALTRRLRLNVRGFYRDLEALRKVGIVVDLIDGKYFLRDKLAKSIERLPFPDPNLNLGEARLLAKGRTKAHRKLRDLLKQIEK